MGNALYSGVSGLVAHQRLLDVTANNIANVNTTAYKSQRLLFDDLIYETIRPASGPSDSDVGGTNPSQVGSGVKVGQIDRRFTPGSLEITGEQFDFAIQGEGFFVVSDGTKNYYTRAGAFSLDASGHLIDATTGYRVQRFGDFGEPDGLNPAFQITGDDSIRIPLNASVPGAASKEIFLEGNLSSSLNPDVAEEMVTHNALELADGTPAVGTTLLNDLSTNTVDYVTGDKILLSLADVDGVTITAGGSTTGIEFSVDATTTVQDLVNEINSHLTDSQATLQSDGKIKITANAVGPAFISLQINDLTGSGKTDWAEHSGTITKEGQFADSITRTVDVFDEQGNTRRVTIKLTKETTNEWSGEVSIEPVDGVVLDGTIAKIRFGTNGIFQNAGDATVTMLFAGMATPQTLQFEFTDGQGVGLTHLGADTSVVPSQDGFGPGSLVGVLVNPDGTIKGIGSNGTSLNLAQIAVAGFTNPKGLKAIGDSLYEETLNSGNAQIGAGISGGRGTVLNSQLENSNVDLALEFTRLVVAQRGFSANARTVTVADSMQQELTNIIR